MSTYDTQILEIRRILNEKLERTNTIVLNDLFGSANAALGNAARCKLSNALGNLFEMGQFSEELLDYADVTDVRDGLLEGYLTELTSLIVSGVTEKFNAHCVQKS